jgi:flavin-dependent dehydrogenase
MAVDRERFDAWLLDRARAAGAKIHEGVTMPHDVEARFVVAADGLHSRQVAARFDQPARIGFSARLTGIDVGDKVEIRFRDGGEVYLAPGIGDTHVAVLRRASRLDGDPGERVIARLLGGAPPAITTPILGMGPLGRRVRDPTRGNLLAIGDAAGAPDPITGDGMSLALRSAPVAAEAIASGTLGTYAVWRRREGEAARALGRRLLGIAPYSDRVVRKLARRPDLLREVMRSIAGEDEAGVSFAMMLRLLLP